VKGLRMLQAFVLSRLRCLQFILDFFHSKKEIVGSSKIFQFIFEAVELVLISYHISMDG
jgi:hypothetical protein